MAGEKVSIEWSYTTHYQVWAELPEGVSAAEFDPGRYDMNEVQMMLSDLDDDNHAVDGAWGDISMIAATPSMGEPIDEFDWSSAEEEKEVAP